MARMTGQAYAKKWADNMKSSGQYIRDGVNAVTEAPGIKAAAKSAKMLAGIQEAISSGKWQKAVAAVPLEQWKKTMLDKGVGRIAAGVDSSMGHMAEMGEKLMQALDTVGQKVRSMPDDTYDQRVQRMLAQIEGMHKVKL